MNQALAKRYLYISVKKKKKKLHFPKHTQRHMFLSKCYTILLHLNCVLSQNISYIEPSVLQNVVVFGNKAFEEMIKFKLGH